MSENAHLSIGEVINLLRDDFPDVSVSKIRFLESQGLIDPDRSESGYRQFTNSDLERLHFILQQQRDHFLPLKVIKSKLTLWERGEDMATKVAPKTVPSDQGEPLSVGDVLKRSGLTEAEFTALRDADVLRPIDGSDVFAAGTGLAALEAKRLMDHGLEPRHLRTVRLAVEREVDLLRQLAEPLLRANNAGARARAADILESSSGAALALHRSLLLSELARISSR